MWNIADFCDPREFFPDKSRGSAGRADGNPHIEIEAAERLYRTILASWPDDFEAWMGLGNLQLIFNWRRGRSITEARKSFERAQELDPDSWRVLWRLFWVSAHERKHGEVEELLRRIYPDRTGETIQEGITVSYGLGREEEKQTIYEELKSASVWEVFTSSLNVAMGTEDVLGAQEIARLLIQPDRPEEIRGLGHALLAHQEAARGRWSAARLELSRAKALNPSYTIEYQALLAVTPFLAVPETDIEAFLRDLIDWDANAVAPGASRLAWLRIHDHLHPVLRTYLVGVLSARLGETDVALERAMELEGMFDIPELPRDSTWIRDLAHGLRAQAAMAEGRLEDALAHFEKARFKVMNAQVLFSSFYFQTLERYLRAEVLFERGRYDEALGWYDSFGWCWGYEFVYLAPAHLRRAQIYEHLGQPDKAIEHYAMFVGCWSDCEGGELRPLVQEAEAKLRELREAAKDG
jgi:tetratricopeptide (TPR) repeat protein